MNVLICMLLVAWVGGALPFAIGRSDRSLHVALALSTGVFLGAVFLHMLPSVSALGTASNAVGVSALDPDLVLPARAHGHGMQTGVWFFVLLGVLGVYLAEALILRRHDHDDQHRHRAVGYAALSGLSIHAFTTGVGLSAAQASHVLGTPLLLAILVHKGFEAFSLVTVFRLADLRQSNLVKLLVFFSLVTPLGMILGEAVTVQIGQTGLTLLTALAAGTFLYVCLCELLPEVFHHQEDIVMKITLLALSIGGMAVLDGIGPAAEWLVEWMDATWMMIRESGPYLLVGFVVAGFLKVYIPDRLIFKHLGGDRFKSVALASLFGAPVPLCSCSVIPTAVSLKKSGASKGATTAFLISTPETGVDSVGVTWALMDPLMTIARPLSAVLTALGSGAAVNLLVRRGWDEDGKDEASSAAELPAAAASQDTASCCAPPPDPSPSPCCAPAEPVVVESQKEESCCDPSAVPASEGAAPDSLPGPVEGTRQAVGYAFGKLLDDLTPWFIVGFLVSGLITVMIPEEFFTRVMPGRWMPMLIMLGAGIPMYICATGSTPVAAALVAKGLDPGAALVFLLAGPATNVATVGVVNEFLGRRVLYVYLGSIALASLLMGRALSALYEALDLEAVVTLGSHMAHGPTGTIAGALLVALLVRSLVRRSRAV